MFPGGHRKLAYYLNEGHYGVFRLFLRDPVPRIPIVVKVRGPFVSCDQPLSQEPGSQVTHALKVVMLGTDAGLSMYTYGCVS